MQVEENMLQKEVPVWKEATEGKLGDYLEGPG